MSKKVKIILLIILTIILVLGIFYAVKISKKEETGRKIVNELNKSEESYDELLFMGRASIRIKTKDNKVIYIDPFYGDEGYDLPADLVLITHEHVDHNNISKIKKLNTDCQIIRSRNALKNGEYETFDFDFAKIEAVEAGYNKNHSVFDCVRLCYYSFFRNFNLC